MTRLPRLKGKEIVRVLEGIGFNEVRTRGSHSFLKHSFLKHSFLKHSFLKHPDGRATVVPLHSAEIIGPGLFRAILRDVEMSIEDFLKLR